MKPEIKISEKIESSSIITNDKNLLEAEIDLINIEVTNKSQEQAKIKDKEDKEKVHIWRDWTRPGSVEHKYSGRCNIL